MVSDSARISRPRVRLGRAQRVRPVGFPVICIWPTGGPPGYGHGHVMEGGRTQGLLTPRWAFLVVRLTTNDML